MSGFLLILSPCQTRKKNKNASKLNVSPKQNSSG